MIVHSFITNYCSLCTSTLRFSLRWFLNSSCARRDESSISLLKNRNTWTNFRYISFRTIKQMGIFFLKLRITIFSRSSVNISPQARSRTVNPSRENESPLDQNAESVPRASNRIRIKRRGEKRTWHVWKKYFIYTCSAVFQEKPPFFPRNRPRPPRSISI